MKRNYSALFVAYAFLLSTFLAAQPALVLANISANDDDTDTSLISAGMQLATGKHTAGQTYGKHIAWISPSEELVKRPAFPHALSEQRTTLAPTVEKTSSFHSRAPPKPAKRLITI